MSLRVQLWHFNKRRNSTKKPDTAAQVTMECSWKHPVSMVNPVIILAADHGTEHDDDLKILNANYAKLDIRYYWIVNCTSVNLNHWELTLEIDALATWKSFIQQTTVFALYSQNAGSGELIDSRLPRRTNGASRTWSTVYPLKYDVPGYTVLGIQGKESINYFAFRDVEVMNDLLNNADDWLNDLMKDVPVGDIEDESWGTGEVADASGEASNGWLKLIVQGISEFKVSLNDAIVKGFNSLIKGSQTMVSTGRIGDSIISAMYYPFDFSSVLGAEKQIYLGQYPSKISAPTVNRFPVEKKLTIVTDSDSWFEEVYQRRGGFCIWSLYIPLLGRIALPNELMGPNREVGVITSVNFNSGIALIKVTVGQIGETFAGRGECVGEYSVQLGFPIAVGTSSLNLSSAVNNVIGTITGGMQSIGGAQSMAANVAVGSANIGQQYSQAVGGIGTAAQGIWGIVNDSVPNMTNIGNAGGTWFIDSNEYSIFLQCDYYGASCVPNTVASTIGIPTFKNVNLSGYSGYIMCSGASVKAPAYAPEIDLINGYLNNGCFIE